MFWPVFHVQVQASTVILNVCRTLKASIYFLMKLVTYSAVMIIVVTQYAPETVTTLSHAVKTKTIFRLKLKI